MQIYGQVLDDAANNGNDKAIDFAIQNTRVYFSGQLNPIVQFGANLDFTVTGQGTAHEATGATKIRDAFINFHFVDALNVMAGYYRMPFSRTTLVDRYNTIFMPQDGWITPEGVYKNQIAPTLYIPCGNYAEVNLTDTIVMGGPSIGNALAITQTTDEADAVRDAGITIWGDLNAGDALAIKYYLGLYDGFGDHNVGNVAGSETAKDNLNYVVRVQFTPTVWGFQPEKGYLLKETYLGKKDVLTFGFGYSVSQLDLNRSEWDSKFDFKSWTVDFNWEQKLVFGNMPLVPKLEVAYTQTDGDNLPLNTQSNGTGEGANLDKVTSWYVKVGTLFDAVVGLGKLGVYVKYQKASIDFQNDENNQVLRDVNPTIWTIAVPYYLADQNAKVVFQWNYYNYDREGLDPRGGQANEDSNSDITLAFQVQF